MAAKKTVANERDQARNQDRKEGEPNLRSGGVEGVQPDSTRAQIAENDRLQRDPPPLVHVNPTTGEVLDKPLPGSGDPNRLTTREGNPEVKDARPNNGQVATGNPNTDKANEKKSG